MTDKKPFAEAEKIDIGGNAHVIIGPVVFPADTEARAELLCERINAYLEDRVKERLEEFRIRVVHDIREFGGLMAKDDWNKRVGAADLIEEISDGIAERVESLPAEFDAK